MKNRKKAELQRKLSMSPLPKPPSGLGERIKRDIPSDFRYTDDRSRFSMFNALSLRVAASILVLVGGAYFAIRLMSEVQQTDLSRAKTSMALPQRAPLPAAPASQVADAKDIALAKQPAPEPAAEPQPTEQVTARRHIEVAQAQMKAKEADRDERKTVDRLDTGAASNAVASGVLASNEPQQTAAAEKSAADTAPKVAELQKNEEGKGLRTSQAPAGAAPVMAAAPAPPPAAQTESIAVTAEAPVMADKKQIASSELFGISTDRQSFDRIKFAIEHGDRPAADSIDVSALVNYFAGLPDHMRHPVALDLEASTRPVRDGHPTALVRVTIDTEETIYDAKLDIVFDDIAVANYHRIGGNHIGSATEAVMNANRSVTALYELQLKPNVRALEAVATATLTYRGAAGAQTLTRRATYGEAQQAWKTKSRRHRLATLGAIWAETLRTQAAGADVAQKAHELSKQEPHDEKAKELATLATASSRLRSSSPTGSGR